MSKDKKKRSKKTFKQMKSEKTTFLDWVSYIFGAFVDLLMWFG